MFSGTSSQLKSMVQTPTLCLRLGLKASYLIKLIVRAGMGPAHSNVAVGLDFFGISHYTLSPSILLLLLLSCPSVCVTNFSPESICLIVSQLAGDVSVTALLATCYPVEMWTFVCHNDQLHIAYSAKDKSGLESWPGSLSLWWTLLFHNVVLDSFLISYYPWTKDCHIVVLRLPVQGRGIPVL